MQKACNQCQQLLDASASTCPHCGATCAAGTLVRATMTRAVARRPKLPVHVVMATTVDRTGSSSNFARGIPKSFEIIARQLEAKARSCEHTVTSHGDLDEHEPIVVLTDRGTPEQAIRDVRSITYGGGGDPEEHHLDAIEGLVGAVAWPLDPRSGRGCILGFMTADSKPLRSGQTPRQLGEAIRAKGLLLYLICEPTPSLEELAQAAGGLLFEISNDPDPVKLQEIANKVPASIAASVAAGSTVPMTTPAG